MQNLEFFSWIFWQNPRFFKKGIYWILNHYSSIVIHIWTFWYLENLINFLDWFIFALISRHFIGLSKHFRLWREMPQIKEPVSNKFNAIEFKIQEILFFQNLQFLLEFFSKIKEIDFFCCIFMDFSTQVFLFGTFQFII